MRFLPESGQAAVSIRLAESNAVISLQFDLGTKGYYSDFKGTGTVTAIDKTAGKVKRSGNRE